MSLKLVLKIIIIIIKKSKRNSSGLNFSVFFMEWFRLEEVEDALNEHAVDDPEEVASMVDTWVTLLFLNISLFFFLSSLSLSHTHNTHSQSHTGQ